MKPVYILAAILIFGVLIAVHELGHFLAAKLCGVRVNEFSIGMGPLIWQRTKGETEYSLRALPIGGYCAMEGEDEDTGDERSFVRQGFWKKAMILVAGSFMNFLTGLVILLALYAGVDYLYADKIVALAPEFAQTGENGLLEGDLIYRVNGYRTYLKGDTKLFLQYAGDTMDIEVVRDGRHIRLTDVPRQTYSSIDGTSTYQGFGIYVGVSVREATPGGKLQYAVNNALDFVQLVWFSLTQLFNGNAGMQDLSGPVGIVSTMTQVGTDPVLSPTVWDGVQNILYFAALLAVNLSVMNLLPIPALDGGRVFFLIVDALSLLLFRRKVPERYEAAVNMAGFMVLMGFMLLVTFHDVFKLFQ